MSKQDRQGARTPAQLEQEYKFGESFAKAFGLAEDAGKKADEAKGAVDKLDKALCQEEIFNRLTKNGEVEGIYRDEAGNVYINASYMVSGILRSKDGKTFYLDLDSGVLKGEFEELSISGKDVVTGDVLEEYAQSVTESIDHLQQQIDGQIQSWFYDYVPTTSNYPASEWTTDALKNEHLGDLFYIVDNEESGGLTYRWAIAGDSYQWVLVEDSDVAKALAQAAKAQDTADGKRRVFVRQPAPPYDEGDLWTDGADLKVCQTARASGSYYEADWKLATDYIDSGTAEEIAKGKVDAQTQADIFNKLTNNGALEGVYMKDGQLYINASYLATGILTSKDGKSFYLDLDNGILKGQFSEFSISGKSVEEIAQEKANVAQDNAQTYAEGVGRSVLTDAASDATAKANDAKNDAISAASQDATDKANNAESNAKRYADSAASAAVNAQTQTDIFNRLTNNGALKGIYMQNGELYINASYLMSGIINASLVKAGIITSADGSIKIDLVSNKIEVGEGTGARPAWDSKLEVDAFGIAGYGRHYATSAFEKTLFIMPGLHYTSSGQIRNKIQGMNGIGLTINTDGGALDIGDLGAETRIYGSIVDIRSKINGENEWLTPPMHTGFEYRTMDRFLGEPVYTRIVDFGASSATTYNWQTVTLPHGISGISKIIKCQGSLSGSKATTLPAIIGGLVSIHADKTNVYLYRETAYTPPSDERLYVQLWYTK